MDIYRSYYIANDKKIMFGLNERGDGTLGEMAMQWVALGGDCVPQLRVFDDAWATLFTFADLLEKMAEVDDQNISPADFINILKECDFEEIR